LTRQVTLTPATYRNELAQNYPNPFNPTTTLAFSLAKGTDVDLRIFDVRGALVKTLVSEHRAAGVHRVPWDGVNQQGNRVASGVYFYKLVAGPFTDTKKLTILK
jgi:flagellar hook assembly protein FlgD